MKTVKDLIEELQKYPPHMPLITMDYDSYIEIPSDETMTEQIEVMMLRFTDKELGTSIVSRSDDLSVYKDHVVEEPIKVVCF